jgi:hypothetical protein
MSHVWFCPISVVIVVITVYCFVLNTRQVGPSGDTSVLEVSRGLVCGARRTFTVNPNRGHLYISRRYYKKIITTIIIIVLLLAFEVCIQIN